MEKDEPWEPLSIHTSAGPEQPWDVKVFGHLKWSTFVNAPVQADSFQKSENLRACEKRRGDL